MKEFRQFLLTNRKSKNIKIFFDIETLTYNEKEGRKKPTNYKNVMYSFAFGFFDKDNLIIKKTSNVKYFINEIVQAYDKWKNNPKIELIAHNTNKYDSHFVRKDLIHFFNLEVNNLYLRNATKEGNLLTSTKNKINKRKKTGYILEKRIKSSNNLEMSFRIGTVDFFTTDNFMKTHTSIEMLGKKLLKLGVLSEEDLKTDYDYTEFNLDHDMTDEQSYDYAEYIFKYKLTPDHHVYIENDIKILAYAYKYYSQIFKGFDYNQITFTRNILNYYNTNDLTSYQLLRSVGEGSQKTHIKYTDYSFMNQNLYDFLKSFYNGGLNFYNQKYVGKIIYDKLIGIDINSSYPHAMYNYKMPTFLSEAKNFEETQWIEPIINDNTFYLYRMNKSDFDYFIISKIESEILRQMLVKYYNKLDYININTHTLRILRDIAKIDVSRIKVYGYVMFECYDFGSKHLLDKNYKTKVQASSDFEVIYKNPNDITVTSEKNKKVFTPEEVDIIKVLLNGLYGIPALRSHFNIFRWIDDELKNIPNGYMNNERNIVFSTAVTGIALYNLLEPLKYLTPYEIDNYFIYCDTDSLYFNKKVLEKFPSTLFDPNIIGKWDIQDETIDKFIPLNHKKYAYQKIVNGKEKIIVKSGGIPTNSFRTNMTFEKFVNTQFSDGISVPTLRSITTKQGTIAIYNTKTKLEVGSGYQLTTNIESIDEMKKEMLEEIRNTMTTEEGNHALFIESNLGTFSMSEVTPVIHENNELDISYLIGIENQMRDILFD